MRPKLTQNIPYSVTFGLGDAASEHHWHSFSVFIRDQRIILTVQRLICGKRRKRALMCVSPLVVAGLGNTHHGSKPFTYTRSVIPHTHASPCKDNSSARTF